MTNKQQTILAIRVAATMRALIGLVGVTDAKVASVCVADTVKELEKEVKD